MLRTFKGWVTVRDYDGVETETGGMAEWDSWHDTRLLDPRTAAVLALGEAVLNSAKGGGMRDEIMFVVYAPGSPGRCALAADAKASAEK